MTREERKAADKARKEAAKAKKQQQESSEEEEEEEIVNDSLAPGNPNAAPGSSGAAPSSGGGMSRKEREAKDAAAAKERYQKLHAAGKTDEAKSDLARLAAIRKDREEKAKQRQAGKSMVSHWVKNGQIAN